MKSVLKIVGSDAHGIAAPVSDVSGGGAPPGAPALVLPAVAIPPISLSQIAAEAEAAHTGQKTIEAASDAVKSHHHGVISKALATASQEPAGLLSTKTGELATVKADIVVRETVIKGTTKGDEIAEDIRSALTPIDQVQLATVVLAAVMFFLWSFFSTRSFLENFAMSSGVGAWLGGGLAVGLTVIFERLLHDPRLETKHLIIQCTYIALAGIAAIVWLLTLAIEAGGNAGATLGDVNAVVSVDDSAAARMMFRGVAQLFMEMFGGAMLAFTVFELWQKKSRRVVYRLRDKWLHETAELADLRNLEKRLEDEIAQLRAWFASHSHITEAYISKAVGHFLSGLNSQHQGA